MTRFVFTISEAAGEDIAGETVIIGLVNGAGKIAADPSWEHVEDLVGEITDSGTRQTAVASIATETVGGVPKRVLRFDAPPSFDASAITDLGGWYVARPGATDADRNLVAFVSDVTASPADPYVITAPAGVVAFGPNTAAVTSVNGQTGDVVLATGAGRVGAVRIDADPSDAGVVEVDLSGVTVSGVTVFIDEPDPVAVHIIGLPADPENWSTLAVVVGNLDVGSFTIGFDGVIPIGKDLVPDTAQVPADGGAAILEFMSQELGDDGGHTWAVGAFSPAAAGSATAADTSYDSVIPGTAGFVDLVGLLAVPDPAHPDTHPEYAADFNVDGGGTVSIDLVGPYTPIGMDGGVSNMLADLTSQLGGDAVASNPMFIRVTSATLSSSSVVDYTQTLPVTDPVHSATGTGTDGSERWDGVDDVQAALDDAWTAKLAQDQTITDLGNSIAQGVNVANLDPGSTGTSLNIAKATWAVLIASDAGTPADYTVNLPDPGGDGASARLLRIANTGDGTTGSGDTYTVSPSPKDLAGADIDVSAGWAGTLWPDVDDDGTTPIWRALAAS